MSSNSNIVYFPNCRHMEPEQPEPETNLDEIEVDYEEMYAPPENYISHDKCYRCDYEFQEDDQIWYIRQQGGWFSIFDQSHIDILICDNCLSDFVKKTGGSRR